MLQVWYAGFIVTVVSLAKLSGEVLYCFLGPQDRFLWKRSPWSPWTVTSCLDRAPQTILPRHRLLTDPRNATWIELQAQQLWIFLNLSGIQVISQLCVRVQTSDCRQFEMGLQSCIALFPVEEAFWLEETSHTLSASSRQTTADSLDKNSPWILSISLFSFLASTYHRLHWSHWKHLQINKQVVSLWLLCVFLARQHFPGFPLAALALLAVLLWCGMIATDQSRLYLDTGAKKCTLPAWPGRDTRGGRDTMNVTTLTLPPVIERDKGTLLWQL